jgi:hypothetical protein
MIQADYLTLPEVVLPRTAAKLSPDQFATGPCRRAKRTGIIPGTL